MKEIQTELKRISKFLCSGEKEMTRFKKGAEYKKDIEKNLSEAKKTIRYIEKSLKDMGKALKETEYEAKGKAIGEIALDSSLIKQDAEIVIKYFEKIREIGIDINDLFKIKN